MSHVKQFQVALLASVFLPLTLAATPVAAQTPECPGGTISGFIWFDANNNGAQDPGEAAIPDAVVTVTAGEGGFVVETDTTGHYSVCLPFAIDSWTVIATVPPGFTASPANSTDDAHDSDGQFLLPGSDGEPDQIYTSAPGGSTVDFGFWHSATQTQPGTGTPGYWKNHAEAWPVASIVVGGKPYTKAQAIAFLNDVGSDKSLTMFSSLVPAMLNVLIGNNSSCVADTITQANNWMVGFPAGSKVKASSAAWKVGEPLHRLMDNYNNGMLCAPHRD